MACLLDVANARWRPWPGQRNGCLFEHAGKLTMCSLKCILSLSLFFLATSIRYETSHSSHEVSRCVAIPERLVMLPVIAGKRECVPKLKSRVNTSHRSSPQAYQRFAAWGSRHRTTSPCALNSSTNSQDCKLRLHVKSFEFAVVASEF